MTEAVGDHPKFKCGKLPARKNAIKAKFAAFMSPSLWPTPPKAGYGYYGRVRDQWGMLGNDRYGCCVLAGAAHEDMVWTRIGFAPDCNFTTEGVLAAYHDITGFNPDDPNSDNGTDMQAAAKYRQDTGILTADGVTRSKIGAYVAPRVGKIEELDVCTYLFKCVGAGFMWPDYATDQFDKGRKLDFVKGKPEPTMGHYVPIVGRIGSNFLGVTWGKLVLIAPAFIKAYMDEGVVYLSEGMLNKQGKSPQGFDVSKLKEALADYRK